MKAKLLHDAGAIAKGKPVEIKSTAGSNEARSDKDVGGWSTTPAPVYEVADSEDTHGDGRYARPSENRLSPTPPEQARVEIGMTPGSRPGRPALLLGFEGCPSRCRRETCGRVRARPAASTESRSRTRSRQPLSRDVALGTPTWRSGRTNAVRGVAGIEKHHGPK